jgi:hypothetical protein
VTDRTEGSNHRDSVNQHKCEQANHFETGIKMKNSTTTANITPLRKFTLAALAMLSLFSVSIPSQAGFMDNLVGNVLGINSPMRRLDLYGQVTDKPLVNAFYDLTPDGKTETIPDDLTKARFEFKGINGVMIAFEKHLSDSANMQGAASSLRTYQSNADTDEIARKYIATATARGNTVRLYQPKLSELLANKFRILGIVDGPGRLSFIGYDRVLIEYDNMGRAVSFVNRVIQGVTVMGVSLDQYTAIYSGEQSIRHFEDGISQADLKHFYIRDLNPLPAASNNPPAEQLKDESAKQERPVSGI